MNEYQYFLEKNSAVAITQLYRGNINLVFLHKKSDISSERVRTLLDSLIEIE